MSMIPGFIIHYVKLLPNSAWPNYEMFYTPYFLELLNIWAWVYCGAW